MMSDDEPRGPNGLAVHCAECIAVVEARIPTLTKKADIKAARRHLKLLRDTLRWSKTRAGYVTPGKSR